MKRDVDDVQNELMELSSDERLRVARNLLKSVPEAGEMLTASDGAPSKAVEVDWTAAAKDRELPEAVLAMGGAPIVPVGEVALLAGFGGAGKSRLVAQIAAAAAGAENGELAPVLHSCTVSAGRPGLGDALRVRGGPVVLVGYEDAAPWVRLRTAGAARWLDGGECGACSRAVDNPERLSAAVLETPLFAPPGRDLASAPTAAWRAVFDRAGEIGARLVVVDPVSLAWDSGHAEHASGPVNDCVAALRAEAIQIEAGILLVAHLPKAARVKAGDKLDAGDVAGSHAWTDRVRGVIVLSSFKDDSGDRVTQLALVKANYARIPEEPWQVRSVIDDHGRPLAWEGSELEQEKGYVGAQEGEQPWVPA